MSVFLRLINFKYFHWSHSPVNLFFQNKMYFPFKSFHPLERKEKQIGVVPRKKTINFLVVDDFVIIKLLSHETDANTTQQTANTTFS